VADEEDKNVVAKSEDDVVENNDELGVGQPTPQDDGITPDEGIEDLKKSIEAQKRMVAEAQRARAEAEKRAYEAQVLAQQKSHEALEANYYSVVGAIKNISDYDQQLLAQLSEAKSMGDYNREAEIQRELIQNARRLQDLERGRDAFEEQRKQPVQPVPPPQIDQIEAWASRLSPQSGDWLRRNRDHLQAPNSDKLVLAAHYKATANGLKVDTPDYFAFVEEEVGIRNRASRRDDYEEDETEVSPLSSSSNSAPRRSVSPPSAPVSRGGTRKGTINLSSAEREAAKISGVSEEEYYRNKMRGDRRAS